MTIKEQKEKIRDLKNWGEVQGDWQGHYRYIIASNCAYEIIILYHYTDSPVLTAKATLYLTGLWDSDNGNILERECLGEKLPIQELLEIAYKDYVDNIK